MRTRELGVLALAVLLCGGVFTTGFAVGRASTAGRPVVEQVAPETLEKVLGKLDEPSRHFVAASRSVAPAVTHIIVTRLVRYRDPYEDFFSDPALERFFGRRRPRLRSEQSTGTGVIVDGRGYVLTNSHVVNDAADIVVRLADGRELKGRALGTSDQTDLALVKIDGKDFPFAPLGDSDELEVGQWVIAIGNPFGLEQTVTAGIVSATRRTGMGIAEYEDFIQTDTPINPGNSGGPLLNLKGEVVGINTAIYSRSGGYQGIGFAVPINLARLVMNRMLQGH
ncbi:MAG: trypsin-like peptidase domain-containing protein [Planctomycetes bacterium]|nr:trypsin-like peptidase domain-containing protein [Planctomycetota bacterium]